MPPSEASRTGVSDVPGLVSHLVRRDLVENGQEPPDDLVRRTANGDDDAVMGPALREVPAGESFEIRPVVGQEGVTLVSRESQLIGVRGAKPSSLQSGDRDEPSGAE